MSCFTTYKLLFDSQNEGTVIRCVLRNFKASVIKVVNALKKKTAVKFSTGRVTVKEVSRIKNTTDWRIY